MAALKAAVGAAEEAAKGALQDLAKASAEAEQASAKASRAAAMGVAGERLTMLQSELGTSIAAFVPAGGIPDVFI